MLSIIKWRRIISGNAIFLSIFSAIRLEKEHEDFKAGIGKFDKGSLKKADTIEKNSLPTKEDIAAERPRPNPKFTFPKKKL